MGALAAPQFVSKEPLVFAQSDNRHCRPHLRGAHPHLFAQRHARPRPGHSLCHGHALPPFPTLYAYWRHLLLLLLPVAQTYVSRFAAGIQGQDLATQMRFGEYRDALTLVRRYPFFGVGFAGAPDIDLYLGVANVYLTIAQVMGLLGLLVFFASSLFCSATRCAIATGSKVVRARMPSGWVARRAGWGACGRRLGPLSLQSGSSTTRSRPSGCSSVWPRRRLNLGATAVEPIRHPHRLPQRHCYIGGPCSIVATARLRQRGQHAG